MHSINERLVKFRLDRRNPTRLRPFVLMQFPGRIYPPIVYTHPGCTTQIHAEIIMISEGPSEPLTPPLSRSDSGPSAFHYPNRYIPLSTCDGGSPESVCPIQLTPFSPGDPVYVLKSQEEIMKKGQHVPCISAGGLRKWASTDNAKRENGFKDPLKREGDRILTIKNDYVVYVVYNDSEIINPGGQSGSGSGMDKATPSTGGSSSADDANRPPPRNEGGSTSADDAARPPPDDGLPPPFTLRELDAALVGRDAGSPQEDLTPLPPTRSHSDPLSGSPDIDPAGSSEPQPPSEPGPSNQPPRRRFFEFGKGKKLSASRRNNHILTSIFIIFTFFVLILFFTFRKSFSNDDLYVEFIHNESI